MLAIFVALGGSPAIASLAAPNPPQINQPWVGAAPSDEAPSSEQPGASDQGGPRSCALDLQNLTSFFGNPADSNTYTLSGSLAITDPPASGELFIRVPGGPSQVLSAPFNDAVVTVNIPGLYADGATRNITASFTAAPGCTDSVSFTAPLTQSGPVLPQGVVIPTFSTGSGTIGSPDVAGAPAADLSTLFVGGINSPNAAVRIPVNLTLGTTVLANYTSFCVELGETVGLGLSYPNTFTIQPVEFTARGTSGSQQGILRPADGIGRVKAGMIRWLFDNHFPGNGPINDNLAAAAFQVALWEITHDNFNPPTAPHSVVTVTTQGTYITTDTAIRTATQTLLDGLNANNFTAAQWESYTSTDWHQVLLENRVIGSPGDGIQDLILAVPLETSPLPASIHAFESNWTGAGLEVSWGTVSETENTEFFIWGHDGKELQLLTPEAIPSQAIDAVTPHRYRTIIRDPRARSMDWLAITAVDVFGHEEVYGLFQVGQAFGRDDVAAPIDWAGIRSQAEQRMALHETMGPRATRVPGPVIGADFRIERPGMHRVTYEALVDAGMDLRAVNPAHLAVTRDGEPVARFVRLGSANDAARSGFGAVHERFGPGSYIEFWGEKPDFPNAIYVDSYVYRVSVAPEQVIEGELVAQHVTTAPPLANHLGSMRINEDNLYVMNAALPDPWMAARLRTQVASERNYVTEVTVGPRFMPGTSGRLEVMVAGGLDLGVSPAHHARVFFNEVEVYNAFFDARESYHIKAEIPADLILPGENSVRVFVPGGTAAPRDMVFVDTVELFYPRHFSLQDGPLLIQEVSPGQRVELADAAARSMPSVFAWDGATLLELRNRDQSGQALSFQTLEDAAMQYWVAGPDGVFEAELIGSVRELDLLAEPAEFLVISHPVFMPLSELDNHPLNDFVNQRRMEGWSVRVIDVTDIQQHFGGGMPLPQAVNRFLQAAHAAFAPSHVLLVGGDSVDYLNNSGAGSISFIPTLYAPTSRIHHTPADGLLADLNGDGVADLAIGRWPVRSPGDLESIVTKTLDWWENAASSRSAVWVADSEDPAQPSFGAQADRMLGQLASAGWDSASLQQIEIDQSASVAAARQQLFETIESGVSFTGFIGHGSPTSWTFQGLLLPNDVAQLHNEGNPTLITTSACYTTYFVATFNDTLAHRLMNGFRRDGNGQPIEGSANGAVAVHGASTLASAQQNELFAANVKARMLEGQTLGEAVRQARSQAAERGMTDQVTNWILLGDPSLRLRDDTWGPRR